VIRRFGLIFVVALAGCGGGGDESPGDDDRKAEPPRTVPPDAVALVGEQPISRADFDRWLAIAAAEHDPGSDRGTPAPGDAGYTALRDQAMTFLISAAWIEQEAAERGIRVEEAEVRRRFEEQKEDSFPGEEGYREFLESSGQTEEDLLFRVRLDLLSTRIAEATGGGESGSGQEALDKFVAGFMHKYRERTLCAEGFEVVECSNGPDLPPGG
jgi:SurA-like protein